MKQAETLNKGRRKYMAVMVLCFIYGGFALLLFLTDVYTSVWMNQSFSYNLIRGPMNSVLPNEGQLQAPMRISADGNHIDYNEGARRIFIAHGPLTPLRIITSPLSLMILASGLISIFAGLAISSLMRQKDIKAIKQQAADNLLLPDEKRIIEALKDSGYESTQTKIAKDTGLNKVQVHRVLKKLESKGLLEKHDYGMTNKIILKRELFE